MKNGFFKYYKPKVVIGLVSIVSIAIFFFRDYIAISLPIISTTGVLLFIIDKWFWNKRLFSWMFWVSDFSGRYVGSLIYNYRDENCEELSGKLKHIKVIHQTGSEIKVRSFTINEDGKKSSESVDEGVVVEKLEGDGQFLLKFSYRNIGNQDLTPHYGTDILKIICKKDNNKLNGRYYTERLPYQTRGSYEDFVWINDNQEHEF